MDASTQAAEQLLQGTFHYNPDLIQLPETIELLTQLSLPMNLSPKEITSEITPEEFISTYKMVKEAMSSSPSGCHVGHYEAAATDPVLAELHSTMMSIPYMTGFSPK